MLISELSVQVRESHVFTRACVGPYPLWFRHNQLSAVNRQDASPFVISALLPAMLLGEDIDVADDLTVSRKLAESIGEIQTIINCWNPVFKQVRINARTSDGSAIETRGNSGGGEDPGNAAFFSAGVDSLYTAIRHDEELDALILINGFDFNMSAEDWRRAIDRSQALATSLGKCLVLVETNLKEFTAWFNLARYANFGASLASIATLLDFRQVFISGHGTYEEIRPSGVHPLIDPLWSTESCSIIHTGLEADRTGKLRLIRQYPELLSKLWVCWKDPGINCGRCSKCVRSYVALQLCGIDDFEFEQPVCLSQVRELSIENDEMSGFYQGFQRDALRASDQELERALTRLLVKYKVKRFLREADAYLFRSFLTRLWNRRLPPEADLTDISVVPRNSDSTMLDKLMKAHRHRVRLDSVQERDMGSVF